MVIFMNQLHWLIVRLDCYTGNKKNPIEVDSFCNSYFTFLNADYSKEQYLTKNTYLTFQLYFAISCDIYSIQTGRRHQST